MAFDVSALGSYTNEQSDKYIYQTLAEGTTIKMIPNVQQGIKSAEKIKIIASTGVWQTGGSCSRTASGTTAFSDRTITVGKIVVDLDFCPETLETKYSQLELTKGSNYDTVTFLDDIINDLQNDDQYKAELAVWSGDTTAGDAYLNKFDGFRKIIGAASGVLTTSTSGSTTWGNTTARSVMQSFASKVASSLPQFLSDPDAVCFIGFKEYMDLKQELINDNLYNLSADEGVKTVEGTEIKLVPVLGLSNTGELYLMKKSNMYLGLDLNGENQKVETWYSQDDRLLKYHKAWKMGVQVAFPSEIIKYITA